MGAADGPVPTHSPKTRCLGRDLSTSEMKSCSAVHPLWSVAQKKSQEKNASKGGFHDWTSLGDLKISKPISDAVFTYPLNQLSPIIEDDEGLHIVRVLDRQEAHQTPFTEVQDEIKEKLRVEVLNRAYNDYVTRLKERTPVIKASDAAAPTGRLAQPHPPANGVSR